MSELPKIDPLRLAGSTDRVMSILTDIAMSPHTACVGGHGPGCDCIGDKIRELFLDLTRGSS